MLYMVFNVASGRFEEKLRSWEEKHIELNRNDTVGVDRKKRW